MTDAPGRGGDPGRRDAPDRPAHAAPGRRDAPAADADPQAMLGEPARALAVAIEALHKASLIHDDIADGDEFRYGRPTLHVSHGVGRAVNVGDWLVGLG